MTRVQRSDAQITAGLRHVVPAGPPVDLRARILADLAGTPQLRRVPGHLGWLVDADGGGLRRALLVATALLLAAGALAVAAGAFRQISTVLGPPTGWIAVAADARAGASFDVPLDAMDVEYGPGPTDIILVGEDLVPRRMFETSRDGMERGCPAFSPDGLRFVYRESPEVRRTHTGATRAAGSATFVVSRLDETGLPADVERIITVPGTTTDNPSCAQWSPDGRSLAYVAADAIGQHELRVVDLDGGEAIFNPAPDATTSGGFAWSPVGRAIAYVDDGLWLVPLTGEPARLLVPSTPEETVEWITWSPDGSVLDVGVSLWDIEPDPTGNGFTGSQVGSEIRRVRLDGTTEPVPEAVAGISQPTLWSPDGSEIAYEGERGIVVTDRAGGQLRLLGAELGGASDRSARPLAWAPDGGTLIAIVPGADGASLALLPTDGQPMTVLTPVSRAFEYSDRESISWLDPREEGE